MKRSKVVALLAIGVGPLALAACDHRPECRTGEPQTQDCQPASSAHGGGGSGSGSHGWWPFAGSSSSSDAVATTSGTVTHGLRKAAGRRLAEAGASTKQIMAVLGLKSIELAELYTRDAEQEHLAEGGMTVWEGKATR